MIPSESVGSSDFYIEKRVSKAPLHNMHHHRSFEIYYMFKGKREYFIEDRFFVINEGDIVVIPRGVFHRTSGEGGLRYLVHFSERFLEKYFTQAALHPLLDKMPFVFRGEPALRERFLLLLEQMNVVYSKSGAFVDEHLLAGSLYQVLFSIAFGNNTYISADHTDKRITKVVQYINENFNTIKDVDEIAEEFYISKYHLCRSFKKNLGISLISYLNTIKIRQACTMIREGNANLTEIAMQSGFNSSSYFSKVFRKETGISPTDYRIRYKPK